MSRQATERAPVPRAFILPLFEAWNDVHLTHTGRPVDRGRWIGAIGLSNADMPFDPMAELVAAAARDGRSVDVELIAAQRRDRRDELIAATPVNPGVIDWLDRASAAGIGLAVASSSSHDWVSGHLHRRGLVDRFGVLACAGGTMAGKPEPDVYLAACDGLGVDPATALAIEDSPTGAAAAKAAGMACLAVPSTMTASLDFSVADLVVTSLAAITVEEVYSSFKPG